jgi:Domain of unknown function (DUF4124)
MKKLTLLIFVIWIISPALVLAQETYQWVDEKGTVHFTDDIGKIPEKYQDQVKKKETPPEPAPSSSIKSPTEKARPAPDAADVEKKDILGRGEDWWRDKAMEWKQKLIKAQKDYAAAQTALKAKDKELEDARFKPKSFQRKLQDEIKVLEEKVNAQKNLVDEAKNMLEKVLPRQAEEYRADPNWVRTD